MSAGHVSPADCPVAKTTSAPAAKAPEAPLELQRVRDDADVPSHSECEVTMAPSRPSRKKEKLCDRPAQDKKEECVGGATSTQFTAGEDVEEGLSMQTGHCPA